MHAHRSVDEVRLEDDLGRRWRLWRNEPIGPGTVIQHVPDLSIPMGNTLASGNITATIRAWAWNGFSESAFLWSDLEREHDVYVESAPVTFSLP